MFAETAVCQKFCKFKVKFLFTEQNSVVLLGDFQTINFIRFLTLQKK